MSESKSRLQEMLEEERQKNERLWEIIKMPALQREQYILELIAQVGKHEQVAQGAAAKSNITAQKAAGIMHELNLAVALLKDVAKMKREVVSAEGTGEVALTWDKKSMEQFFIKFDTWRGPRIGLPPGTPSQKEVNDAPTPSTV